MNAVLGLADAAVDALDGSRRWLWRQVARTRAGRACARDRSSRVLALGLGHVGVALALAAIAPGILLLIGPLVLGVPHVAADLRYLVVRGPASLRGSTIIAMIVPLAALTGFGVIDVMGGAGNAAIEIGLGFSAIAVATVLAPGPARRRAIVLTSVVAIAIPAITWPGVTLAVLLFGHNLVAFAIWIGWTRTTVRLGHRLAVTGAAACGVVAIACGVADRGWDGAGIVRLPFAEELDPVLAWRLVVAYAYLQALHYVVWLRLIPSTQAVMPSASPFRRSLASLRADFGGGLWIVIVAVTVAVPLLALFALPAERVRDGYLALVLFHVWLELAMLAYVTVTREVFGGSRS